MNRLKICLHLEDENTVNLETENCTNTIIDMLRKSRVASVEIAATAEVRETRFFNRVWVR